MREAVVVTANETPDDVLARKRALRREVRERREARSPAEREAVADALAARVLALPEVVAATGSGAGVAAYASYRGEPGTGPLLAALVARGVSVVLPRLADGAQLEWVRYDGPASLTPSARGIPEPAGPAIGTGADGLRGAAVAVVLVPATAVDGHGRRLGQGLGCYDRVLAELPSHRDGGPLLVGLVHDDEVLGDGLVPVEPHDRELDVLVTPTRTLRLRERSAT